MLTEVVFSCLSFMTAAVSLRYSELCIIGVHSHMTVTWLSHDCHIRAPAEQCQPRTSSPVAVISLNTRNSSPTKAISFRTSSLIYHECIHINSDFVILLHGSYRFNWELSPLDIPSCIWFSIHSKALISMLFYRWTVSTNIVLKWLVPWY